MKNGKMILWFYLFNMQTFCSSLLGTQIIPMSIILIS